MTPWTHYTGSNGENSGTPASPGDVPLCLDLPTCVPWGLSHASSPCRELKLGIPVTDENGNRLGESTAAAQKAIFQVVVSRIGMAAPAMGEYPLLHPCPRAAAGPWQCGTGFHGWQGCCEHWELISFPSAPAIPPVIMNALEKRAFLKVLLVLGEWAQGHPRACACAGTPWGWHPVGKHPAPSAPLTSASPCSWQRYPYLNAPLQVGLVGLW